MGSLWDARTGAPLVPEFNVLTTEAIRKALETFVPKASKNDLERRRKLEVSKP